MGCGGNGVVTAASVILRLKKNRFSPAPKHLFEMVSRGHLLGNLNNSKLKIIHRKPEAILGSLSCL